MFDWLQSSNIALLVLFVLLIEGLGLAMIWKKSAKGLRPIEIVSFLGAGACFALCLLVVLAQAAPIWIGVTLAGAFLFHILDLRLRWHG